MNPFKKFYSARGLSAIAIGIVLYMAMPVTYAQVTSGVFDQITHSYELASGGWAGAMLGYANTLFWLLAAIEFAWSGITWALEKDSMNAWTTAFIKKIMSIGFFYTLLLKATIWIPLIVKSFSQAGKTAGGSGGLSPSDIVSTGISTAAQMLTGIKNMSLWDDFGSIIIAGLAAIAIVVAFVIIAAQLMIALIESYITISAGMLFLGFGGSRWTLEFTQKFLSYAMATGIKLMMLYLIVGLGINQANNWAGMLASAVGSDGYINSVLAVLGASLVLCFLAFQIPAMAASMLSGAPTMTAGSMGSTVAAVAGGAVAAGGAAISPALREARGAMQAVTSGYGAARASGGGVLGSAVSGLGTAGAQMGKEAARSLGSALGVAAPSSSKSGTIGGRAADAIDAKKAATTGGAKDAKADTGTKDTKTDANAKDTKADANAKDAKTDTGAIVTPPPGVVEGNPGGADEASAASGNVTSSSIATEAGVGAAGASGSSGAAGETGSADAPGDAGTSGGGDPAAAADPKSAASNGQGSSSSSAAKAQTAAAGAAGKGSSAAGLEPTSSQSPSKSMDGANQTTRSDASTTNAAAPPVSSGVNVQGQDADAAEATRMGGQVGYTGPDGQYQPTGVYDAPSTLEKSATGPSETASKDLKPANYDKLKRPLPSDQAGGGSVNIRMNHTDD